MRELYQIVFLLTMFVYSVNLFLVFIGDTLGIQQLSALAIPEATTEATITESFDTLNSTATGGFNTALIFGDWIKPINTFLAIVTLQGVVNMVGTLGQANDSFMTPFSFILAVLGIGALIYLISGRQ